MSTHLADAPSVDPAPLCCEPVVEVTGVCYSYSGHLAVDHVGLIARSGEVLALLGTNGAGKTTLLELLLGQRRPDSGVVRVLGVDPHRKGSVVRRASGVMLQEAGFVPELTVEETVRMWRLVSSRDDDPDAVLERVGLLHRRNVAVEQLSGGERRRLDVALAVWGEPRLVVLDEPTTGLDPASRAGLWGLVRDLRDRGATILLTTHYLEEAEALADQVAIMHQGRIAVAGPLQQVLSGRPARITAEVRGWDQGAWDEDESLHRLVGGPLRITSAERAGGRTAALELETTELQDDLAVVLAWARRRDVRLRHLRAVSASLEEVFHAVRRGEDLGAGTEEGR